MFTANRVMENIVGAHGLFSAEGESDVLLLKVGGELLRKINYKLPKASRWGLLFGQSKPSYWLKLLRYRERKLVNQQRFQIFLEQQSKGLTVAWEHHAYDVMHVAIAHTERLIAEAFFDSVQNAKVEPEAREILVLLFEVYCLDVILGDLGWFVAHDAISKRRARSLSTRFAKVTQQLVPQFMEIVQAFEIDNDILRAPIGEEVYTKAFDFLFGSGDIPQDTVMENYYRRRSGKLRTYEFTAVSE